MNAFYISVVICCLLITTSNAQTINLTYDAFGNRLTKSRIGTNPNPVITSTSSAVCKGQTVQLNATGGNSYVWNNGRTGSTLSINADSTKVYSVTAYNTEGCSAVAFYKLIVSPCSLYSRVGNNERIQSPVMIKEEKDADWSLYPNPTSNGTTVHLVEGHLDKVVISVYDALGRKLVSKTPTGKMGYNVPLEKSLFPISGIYLIQVNYNEKTTTKKLWVTY